LPPATAATWASRGKRGDIGSRADRDGAAAHRLHQFRRGRLLDPLDLADGIGRDARGACHFLTRVPWRGERHRLVGFGLQVVVGFLDHARGQDLLLAQGHQAALEIGDAAACQLVVDHPQLDVLDRVEVVVLERAERDVVLAADGVAVVAVDQDVLPQDQRLAASFGEQAALQGFVFGGSEGVDVSTELVVNRDIQFRSLRVLLHAVAYCCDCCAHATPCAGSAKAGVVDGLSILT
jgi:hypothetical protein